MVVVLVVTQNFPPHPVCSSRSRQGQATLISSCLVRGTRKAQCQETDIAVSQVVSTSPRSSPATSSLFFDILCFQATTIGDSMALSRYGPSRQPQHNRVSSARGRLEGNWGDSGPHGTVAGPPVSFDEVRTSLSRQGQRLAGANYLRRRSASGQFLSTNLQN